MMKKPAFDLKLLEENSDDLFENAPCGYLSALPDGSIIKVNRTLLEMLGYSAGELLGGRRFQDLLTVGGKIFFETHFGPLLQMQGFVKEVTFDLVGKNGRKIPVLTSVAQKRADDGTPLVNRISVFDITDRKKYERELLVERQKAEKAARAKADFLSMMSHEIRTPMNAVVGVSHLLETTDLSAVQKEYLELLKTSSDNLMNLLNSILDFSKIESGHVTLEARTFDLKKVIRDCVTSLQGRAQQKNIALKLLLDRTMPDYFVGDPVKIGQVINNLVTNAIKFTNAGSVSVKCDVVSLSSTSAKLKLAVEDTGIGIAPEKLMTIFDEFSQADYDIGVRFGGSGLGLAICKKIVQLHGSEIDVRSEAGVGSVFEFTLNLQIGAALAAVPPKYRKPNPAQLVGLRILLADDNEDNTFLLERFFASWGIESVIVSNGRDAVEKARSESFDVVLMDLRMPIMDGYTSMKVGEEDLANVTPFNDMIGKPFRPEELFSKLAYYGRRSES
jgi:PAS domain S-box-containing protein